jgi:hypothetical protein
MSMSVAPGVAIVVYRAVMVRVLRVSLAKTGFWAGGAGGAGGGENGFLGRCDDWLLEGGGPEGATMSCKTIKGLDDVPFRHDINHS